MTETSHVFISHVSENRALVERLAADLEKHQLSIWLAQDEVLPGERWPDKIRRAIRSGTLFIAFFTRDYTNRDKTYMNEELAIAIDELRQKPSNRVWFIPVVALGGSVPDLPIGAGQRLTDLQHVDLSKDWARGVERIARMAQGGRQSSVAASSWHVIGERVAKYSTTSLLYGLATGTLAIPDYRFEEALFELAVACRLRIDSVTFNDVDIWGAAEPRSARYQSQQAAAVLGGVAVNRMIVLSSGRLHTEWARAYELFRDHLVRRIGLALVIADGLPEANSSHFRQPFVMFDDAASLAIGGRDAPWVLIAFMSNGVIAETDRVVDRQRDLYARLVSHVALATDDFVISHGELRRRIKGGFSRPLTLSHESQLDEKLYLVADSRR